VLAVTTGQPSFSISARAFPAATASPTT
jgi:hypothetical protein